MAIIRKYKLKPAILFLFIYLVHSAFFYYLGWFTILPSALLFLMALIFPVRRSYSFFKDRKKLSGQIAGLYVALSLFWYVTPGSMVGVGLKLWIEKEAYLEKIESVEKGNQIDVPSIRDVYLLQAKF